MKVDPAGLLAATQRLTEALSAVSGDDPVHPPLGADPASQGGAARLSAAAAALAGYLAAQAAGLVSTAQTLGLAAAAYAAADEHNAANIASLGAAGPGGARGLGEASPATIIPADVRAVLAPVPAASGEQLSAAVHAGDPAAGQAFAASWSRVAMAAADVADAVRSVVRGLPDVLDSAHATPAISAHLLGYANGFEAAGQRAGTLARQADEHGAQRLQAGTDIPHPDQFAAANEQVREIAFANQRTAGAYAIPLAQAEENRLKLNAQATAAYSAYHSATDAATAGEGGASVQSPEGAAADSEGSAEDAVDPATGEPLAGVGLAAPEPGAGPGGGDPASPGGAGELAGMLPAMIPALLGTVGGLLGGAVSAVTKVPEAVMQAGTQAASAATQGLSGLMDPRSGADVNSSLPDLGTGAAGGAGAGDVGDLGAGGGGGETTPAAGGPTLPPVGVSPSSTGTAPAVPSIPAGAGTAPGSGSAAPAGAMMPMGMPMGGMPGAQGGAGAAKPPAPPSKKVVVPEVPHTEAVTGKISTDRVVSATAASVGPDEPPPDAGPVPRRPAIVKRLTTPPRDEDS